MPRMAEPEALVDGREERDQNTLYIRNTAIGFRETPVARATAAGSALSRQDKEVSREGMQIWE
jgi:hypothetical protein